MKDKVTRESKGVAFVLYVARDSAHNAARAMNRKELFGRTLKCRIANDNGRTSEFIRKRTYGDKTRCYECGEAGHLSYCCPSNTLGDRPQPEKKPKKRKREDEQEELEEEEEEEEEDDDLTLSEAIR